MKLYLVRHGESEHNASGAYQDSNSKLTPLGVNQSIELAHRISKIKADLIIASPFLRTKHTAEIVSKEIDREITYSDLFVEIKRATEVERKTINDPIVKRFKELVRENFSDPSFRFSDEETFFDFRSRVAKALQHLISLNKQSIILISHGAVFKMMISVMAYGEEVDPNTYLKLRNLLHDHNTGITMCEYEDKKWKLLTWNDYAHLG